MKVKVFPSLRDSQFSGAVCGNLSIYSRIEFPLYPIQLLLSKLRKVPLLKKITGSARPLSACGTFFWDQPDQENNNIVDLHPSQTKPQKNITWTPPRLNMYIEDKWQRSSPMIWTWPSWNVEEWREEGELYVKDNEARLDNNEPRLNSTPLTFASVVLSRIPVLFMKTIQLMKVNSAFKGD